MVRSSAIQSLRWPIDSGEQLDSEASKYSKMIKFAKISTVVLTPKFQRLCRHGAMVFFLLIVVIGNLPRAREDIGQYASGVVLHSAAYAILALLIAAGSRGSEFQRGIKATLTIVVMGALDEYAQSFFPYRTASIMDWMIDVASGGLASALF